MSESARSGKRGATGATGAVAILGATSAIARATARELAGAGYDLLLAAREPDQVETLAADLRVRGGRQVWTIPFDATDYDGHGAFVENCIEIVGGELEGVLLCFGNMPPQELAQRDWAAAQSTIELNYTSAVSLLERFAGHLEARGRGWICGVSSVAGDRGRMSNYIYGSAKAGFSAYLAGLRNRLWHAGVRVVTVKPGPVDTPMTYGMEKLPFLAQPETIGRLIVKAIAKRRDVAYTPGIWRWIMLAIRNVPEWKFKRMKM
jgi:short-subunit dehydrogenase